MRVPLEWLKEYVTIRLTPEALAERLTMAGLEVVGIERHDGQPVLELEITPNRADCLSVIGIAREVAIVTGQRVKTVKDVHRSLIVEKLHRTPNTEHRTDFTLRIDDRKGCQRYIGRLIEGVRIGPSPEWMQRRLGACGIRPINNVVDVTNYVLLEYGQPLHAFDADRLAQGTVIVRRAGSGEPITTLDGEKRVLSADVLVIADAKQPVAVAGIMGGMGSEVTPQTTRVLLESALFDPITVRRTARKLGLASESSYRFERGVDPGGVESASARAAALITELAGGQVTVVREVGAKPAPRRAITLDQQRLNAWLGTTVSPVDMRTMLARLSCRVASTDTRGPLRVTPPLFRRDLSEEVDLYEEIARVIGYDQLPSTLPVAPLVSTRSDTAGHHARLQSLGCLCVSLGLTETINWSLLSEHDLAQCGISLQETVRLANPLSQDHAYLRPSLLSGLLRTVRRNLTHGGHSVRLFELGSVVRPGTPPAETWQLGIALSGWWSRDWHTTHPTDFFQLKGLIEALIGRLCTGALEVTPAAHRWAEPDQAAVLTLNGRILGVAGQVSRAVAEALDLEQAVWYADLLVETLLAFRRSGVAIQPPAQFPPVKRDLSVLIGNGVLFEQIRQTIQETGGTLAAHVELIDRYTGKQVGSGKYSLTFSIEYRDPARTLTAAEVDVLHQRVGHALVERLGATLR